MQILDFIWRKLDFLVILFEASLNIAFNSIQSFALFKEK